MCTHLHQARLPAGSVPSVDLAIPHEHSAHIAYTSAQKLF